MIVVKQGTEAVLMLKTGQWHLLRRLLGSMNGTDAKTILELAGYTDVEETQQLIYKLVEECDY